MPPSTPMSLISPQFSGNWKRRLATLPVVVAATLAAAGCGASSSGPDTPKSDIHIISEGRNDRLGDYTRFVEGGDEFVYIDGGYDGGPTYVGPYDGTVPAKPGKSQIHVISEGYNDRLGDYTRFEEDGDEFVYIDGGYDGGLTYVGPADGSAPTGKSNIKVEAEGRDDRLGDYTRFSEGGDAFVYIDGGYDGGLTHVGTADDVTG